MNYFSTKRTQFPFAWIFILPLFGIILACGDGIAPEQDQPINVKKLKEHLISIDQARDGYSRYSIERIALTADTLRSMYSKEFQDTRMVWFDLETIKSYIAYVEKASAKGSIIPDGLQFYFSVHPTNGTQPNQQSFFIAPTEANKNSHSGYTLVKKGDSTQVVYLKDILKERGNTAMGSSQVMSKAALFNFLPDPEDELDGVIINMGSGTPPGGNN